MKFKEVSKRIYLKELSLLQFKNYAEATFGFSPGVNCLLGENGSGKTNVLDAIHYLSVCKSYFNPQDGPAVTHGHDFFMIRGEYVVDGQEESIACSVRKGQKKTVRRNSVEYDRLSEHIGLLPSVMISPYDIELVLEGSEIRRRFMDTAISQYRQEYLRDLIQYNHALLQRNNLIKAMARRGEWHNEHLEPWNIYLVVHGSRIHAERQKFIGLFQPVFTDLYRQLSDGAEGASVGYASDLLENSMEDLLQRNEDRDRMLERTSTGIHRDDLELELDGYELKKFASQGQQKTYLIALKLAQFHFLANTSGKLPTLMLDDIFDKLDEKRTGHLLEFISSGRFGQVFITDTHVDRIPAMLAESGIEARYFHVTRGKVDQFTDLVDG